jgi:hypothetical protein
MPAKYQVGVLRDDGIDYLGKPVGLVELDKLVRTKLEPHRGDGFQLKQRGPDHEYGHTRNLTDIVTRVHSNLKDAKIGSSFMVLADVDGYRLIARKIQVDPPVKNTEGNDRVDVWHSAVFSKWNNCQDWGIYVCKDIVGTDEPSQHSYANADDIYHATAMRSIFNYGVQNNGKYNIAHIIYAKDIWSVGIGLHVYTGEYHGHVHTDFLPQYSGECRHT